MIVFEDEAVGRKEYGDKDSWVEQMAELRSRGCKDVAETLRFEVEKGCHGKQYLTGWI